MKEGEVKQKSGLPWRVGGGDTAGGAGKAGPGGAEQAPGISVMFSR